MQGRGAAGGYTSQRTFVPVLANNAIPVGTPHSHSPWVESEAELWQRCQFRLCRLLPKCLSGPGIPSCRPTPALVASTHRSRLLTQSPCSQCHSEPLTPVHPTPNFQSCFSQLGSRQTSVQIPASPYPPVPRFRISSGA